MEVIKQHITYLRSHIAIRYILLCISGFFSFSAYAQSDTIQQEISGIYSDTTSQDVIVKDTLVNNDSIYIDAEKVLLPFDTLATEVFIPSPTTAVWRAAIFPGMGQIYNRKYWKLPIIYGGFVALIYAVSWNGKYYKDYSIAYRDLMDNNPNTDSFLNFLPPGKTEEDYDQEWLRSTFKRKNDYFRRNRDLSIIGMVGVYLISILDAYVDAQLYDFDISPDLTLRMEPTIMPSTNQYSSGMVGFKLSFKIK